MIKLHSSQTQLGGGRSPQAGRPMSAFVTLLLNDAYLKGAQVLAHSLRDVDTKHELAVMVTSDVSPPALATLLVGHYFSSQSLYINSPQEIYDQIIEVDPIHIPSLENLNLLGRLDLSASLTKLNLWKQIQYQKVVFLDADTVALQNIDHLFDLDVEFAAAPDIGWPDIFNSGVFVAKPNIGTYAALRQLADAGVSFDGGDQGLLNTYYPQFHRLSFTYNVTPSAGYQYLPAFRHFESQIKVAHFIGAEKPWQKSTDASRGTIHSANSNDQILARWWAVYDRHYPSSYVVPVIPNIRNRSQLSPPASVLATIEESSPFEAPENSWDAQKSAPPTSGQPQAADLQYMSYENSWDQKNVSGDFIPPAIPRIPKSVHFEPPKTLDPTRAIFPWEGKNVAQRSFPEDAIAPLQQVYMIERNESPHSDESELGPGQAFADYQVANAWDSIKEIKEYAVSLPGNNSRPRAPSSTWGSGSNTPQEAELPEGRSEAPPLSTSIPGSQQHVRTDFLSQEPRGLPRPEEWNPAAQLAQLASNAQSLANEAANRQSERADSGTESHLT